MFLQRNTASQVFTIPGTLRAVADGSAVTSGASLTWIKDGTSGASAGTLTHVSDGAYTYQPTQGETDAKICGWVLSKAGAAGLAGSIRTTNADPNDGVHLGITSLPNTACTTNASLLTSGTGIDQISVSSGKVLLQATQSGVTIPTVTTVTNQLTAAAIATAVWQDSTAGDFTAANSIGKSLAPATLGTVPGAAGGLFIAGTNAATTITTALTTTFTGNLTGSVGSVTGAVGSVTGAVGSVTGNVGGNVSGSVGSVVAAVTLSAGDSPVFFTGTATAGGASTLTDSGQTWTVNALAGCRVKITSGTGAKQSRVIVSNTATQLTADRAWVTNPSTDSVYAVIASDSPKTDSNLKVAATIATGDIVDVPAGSIPSAAAGAANGLIINGANTGPISWTGGMSISSSTGHALNITSTHSGSDGLLCVGPNAGIFAQASGVGGNGIIAWGIGTNANGFLCLGSGTGVGMSISGGPTGNGITVTGGGTSGVGISILTTSGDGLSITPTAGHAITATANGTSKHGLNITGGTGGTSDGAHFVAGTGGVDLRANITGNLSGTVTTATNLTNLPSIPNSWLTAAGIAAGALNGKGDWNTTTPPTVAQIATGVWTDTTGSDFTTNGTPGKILVAQLGGTFTSATSSVFTAPALANAPSGGGGNVTVGGYASGQDPASLVLNAVAANYNTAGSIGHAIGAAGSAADPWGGVINTTQAGTLMRAIGAVVVGNINAESSDHTTTTFKDATDGTTTRVTSVQTPTTRTVTLH